MHYTGTTSFRYLGAFQHQLGLLVAAFRVYIGSQLQLIVFTQHEGMPSLDGSAGTIAYSPVQL